jgi:hypothetical protein
MQDEFRHEKMPVDMAQLPSHVDSNAAHNRLGEACDFSPAAWITLRVIHRSTGTTTVLSAADNSYFNPKNAFEFRPIGVSH